MRNRMVLVAVLAIVFAGGTFLMAELGGGKTSQQDFPTQGDAETPEEQGPKKTPVAPCSGAEPACNDTGSCQSQGGCETGYCGHTLTAWEKCCNNGTLLDCSAEEQKVIKETCDCVPPCSAAESVHYHCPEGF
jgi:hypothetical protein